MTEPANHWLTVIDELGPKFHDRAVDHDARDAFVAENYAEMKAAGLFSAMVPAELGGGGVTHGLMCAMLRRLAACCGSTALALSMHQHLVGAAIFNYRRGNPGQKLLQAVAADEKVLVSTGARDWMESNGSMEKTDGGYLVSARKSFGSGSPSGSILVTSAPYQHPAEGWQVCHFPVPLDAEGVSADDDWRTFGMRATGSNTVVLERVFVPEEAIVVRRPRGGFHPLWNMVIPVALSLISAVYLGIAQGAADRVRRKLHGRDGDPILEILLGEMENRLTTALLAHESQVAIVNDLDFEPSVEVSDRILVRKTLAVEAARLTVEKALEASGGAGFYRDYGLDLPLRDVFAGQFHPLPEKKQQQFTGRVALGLEPITGEKPAQSSGKAA